MDFLANLYFTYFSYSSFAFTTTPSSWGSSHRRFLFTRLIAKNTSWECCGMEERNQVVRTMCRNSFPVFQLSSTLIMLPSRTSSRIGRLSKRIGILFSCCTVLRNICADRNRDPKQATLGHLLRLHPAAPQNLQRVSAFGGWRDLDCAIEVTWTLGAPAANWRSAKVVLRGIGSCLFFNRLCCGAPPRWGGARISGSHSLICDSELHSQNNGLKGVFSNSKMWERTPHSAEGVILAHARMYPYSTTSCLLSWFITAGAKKGIPYLLVPLALVSKKRTCPLSSNEARCLGVI